MKFKNNDSEALWEKTVKCNQDTYGKTIIVFAKSWVEHMEEMLDTCPDMPFGEVAQTAERGADGVKNLSGAGYGCAVVLLSEVWACGDALRCWHNDRMQISCEVREDDGRVIDPAMINVR